MHFKFYPNIIFLNGMPYIYLHPLKVLVQLHVTVLSYPLFAIGYYLDCSLYLHDSVLRQEQLHSALCDVSRAYSIWMKTDI